MTESQRAQHMVDRYVSWLPLAITFFGIAFIVWMIVQILTTMHLGDQIAPLERRVERIEHDLRARSVEQPLDPRP
jgi:hypothetical protein